MTSKVLHAKNRAETKERLSKKVADDGPYEALVIKMGTVRSIKRGRAPPNASDEYARSLTSRSTKIYLVGLDRTARSSLQHQPATTNSTLTG